jgi:hypothetical protein
MANWLDHNRSAFYFKDPFPSARERKTLLLNNSDLDSAFRLTEGRLNQYRVFAILCQAINYLISNLFLNIEKSIIYKPFYYE